MEISFYSHWEIENQSQIKRVDVSDGSNHYGFEPEATLKLKEPGRFSMNSLVATLKGKHALHQFKKGDIVAVQLRFNTYKKHGKWINDISIQDIKIVKDLSHLFL